MPLCLGNLNAILIPTFHLRDSFCSSIGGSGKPPYTSGEHGGQRLSNNRTYYLQGMKDDRAFYILDVHQIVFLHVFFYAVEVVHA